MLHKASMSRIIANDNVAVFMNIDRAFLKRARNKRKSELSEHNLNIIGSPQSTTTTT